ncbi:FHA domain-containing protein [Brachybacterium sp. Marseille-Q2903]|uniref:FHA domain-containing protein n=1 Tax=Brachybacterium epidermidis TaxID=2781983 RepID=A0ABR9VXG2_9MICO|nr:FHA domain-containing protein [Brachybacterium epidermidis]MBE9402877.1 FHA domain-containing protein [Brachybacterium epidermidis]
MPAPSPAPAVGAGPRPAAPAHAGSAAPGGQQAARAVVIPGLLCPHGHPNCPERTLCRTCGGPLEQKTRPVHRPPLGTVDISTGGGFVLDRSAVIGRRPRASRVSADDVPQLVTVPSPQQDISRSHLELRLEGWRVIALDMGTTNGTTLERPGMEPVRLRAGEGVVLGEGDRLDLGDGVRLTMRGMA